MIDINLLPAQNVLTQKEKYVRKVLTIIVIVSGSVLLLAVVTLILVSSSFGSKLRSVEDKRSNLLANFNSQSELTRNLQTIRDKLSGAQTIYSGKKEMDRVIEDLLALFNPDIIVTQVNMEQDGKIDFTGSAPNLEAFNLFMDRLDEGKASKKFDAVVMRGLREKDDMTLSFSVSMVYTYKKT